VPNAGHHRHGLAGPSTAYASCSKKKKLRQRAVLSLVVGPHSDDFDNLLFFEYLINQTMLDIDPTSDSSGQITDQLFIRWRILIRISPKDVQ